MKHAENGAATERERNPVFHVKRWATRRSVYCHSTARTRRTRENDPTVHPAFHVKHACALTPPSCRSTSKQSPNQLRRRRERQRTQHGRRGKRGRRNCWGPTICINRDLQCRREPEPTESTAKFHVKHCRKRQSDTAHRLMGTDAYSGELRPLALYAHRERERCSTVTEIMRTVECPPKLGVSHSHQTRLA